MAVSVSIDGKSILTLYCSTLQKVHKSKLNFNVTLIQYIKLVSRFFGPRYIGGDFFLGPRYIGDDF
jgi:hypothetical protein